MRSVTYGTSKVVPGALAIDASGRTTGNLVGYDAESKTFTETGAWQSAFAADANVRVTGTVTAEGTAVNALSLGCDAAGTKLTLAGPTTVASGMIVMEGTPTAQGKNNTAQPASSVSGGSLTTGNGKDLHIHDRHNYFHYQGNKTYTRITSPIVDPAESTPMALVLSGYYDTNLITITCSPMVGLDSTANTYSGGTYLHDVWVEIAGDGSFGAVPVETATNVWVTGVSGLRPKDGTTKNIVFSATRGFHITDDALLAIGGSAKSSIAQYMAFYGPITGGGTIHSGEQAGDGQCCLRVEYRDLRSFTGGLIVAGNPRIVNPEDAAHATDRLSSEMSVVFRISNTLTANPDRDGGCLEMSGTFERMVGTGPGQVSWQNVAGVHAEGKLSFCAGGSGGFAAVGGPLTVRLTSPLGGPVVRGQTGLAEANSCILLQNGESTHPLTWAGDFDLNTTDTFNIRAGYLKTAAEVFWTGNVTNRQSGTGTLAVYGRGQFAFGGSACVAPNVTVAARGAVLGVNTESTVTFDGTVDYGTVESGAYSSTRVDGSLTADSYRFYKKGTGTCVFNGDSVLRDLVISNGTVEVNGTLSVSNLVIAQDGVLTGSGRVNVSSDAEIAGAIKVAAARTEALVSVAGNVAFSETARVLPVDAAAVPVGVGAAPIPVLTWTGSRTGLPAVDATILAKWRTIGTGHTVVFAYVPRNTTIIVR